MVFKARSVVKIRKSRARERSSPAPEPWDCTTLNNEEEEEEPVRRTRPKSGVLEVRGGWAEVSTWPTYMVTLMRQRATASGGGTDGTRVVGT